MSIKPFKKVIGNEEDKTTILESTIVKPFKIDSEEIIDTSETVEHFENILDNDNIQPIVAGTNFFNTFKGVVATVFIFVLIAVIADTIETLSNILSNGSISSYI